jgi:aspartate kinase
VARAAAHAADLAATAPLVVVVSALHGRTDELLARGERLLGRTPRLGARASDLLVAAGEIEATAAFALALEARGVVARPLAPHELGLRTRPGPDGPVVFAAETTRLRRFLAKGDVLVIPGFVAVAADFGRVTTLGRGGSDWTAVLLAAALGAPAAEFVKDVPGLFAADPRRDATATHLPFASYAEARALARNGARCLMARAVDEAERRGVRLRLGSLDDPRSTLVGPAEGA